MDSLVQDRVGMSEAEWTARCDLAALYRVVDHLGWTDLIDTHMSVRVPGEPQYFLINHYEEMFDEITASSLIKMDLDGKVYGKQGRFNAAGFTIHSGVYKARPDVNCVMHTHTRAGGGVSLMKQGLLTAQATLPGALRGMYMLERACELELISRQLGEEPVAIDDYIIQRGAQYMKQRRSAPEYGVSYFEALKRQLVKKGAGDWAR